jgi:hypothetical protein
VTRARIALVLLAPGRAAAHDLRPGVLTLVDAGDGDYALRFVPPVDNRGDFATLAIELPAGCERSDDLARSSLPLLRSALSGRVHCAHGLSGRLAIRGITGDAMKVVVAVVRGPARREWLLDAATPAAALDEPPPSHAALWLRVGIAHILGGYDHLAFVVGLLLVLGVSLDRRLLATITAFTLAHSVTLALAVLGVVRVPIAPVEACIAASVLLIAREATHREPTAIRRWPWLAAAGFGLIHGLGFAAALGELGLPRGSLAWALGWFNAGIELGQLAVVAAVVLVVRLGRRLVRERRIVGVRVHRAACYVLGALAAWWLLARVVDLAGGGR